MVKPFFTPKQKIVFALIINVLLFGGISALGFLGFTIVHTLLIFSIVISLEAIGLVIFIEIFLSKNAQILNNLEKTINKIRDDEEKKEAPLLYIGHQIRIMQHELSILRKSSILKPSGNGHSPKAHV